MSKRRNKLEWPIFVNEKPVSLSLTTVPGVIQDVLKIKVGKKVALKVKYSSFGNYEGSQNIEIDGEEFTVLWKFGRTSLNPLHISLSKGGEYLHTFGVNDEPIVKPQKKGSTKISRLVVLFLLVAAVLTNPDMQDYEQELRATVKRETGSIGDFFLGKTITDIAKSHSRRKNFIIFSVFSTRFDKRNSQTMIGVFGKFYGPL